MVEENSITKLENYIGNKVEIIAFGISYIGVLEEVDDDRGVLKISEGEDFVILEIERVESFSLFERLNAFKSKN